MTKVCSSTGIVSVPKTEGCGFESSHIAEPAGFELAEVAVPSRPERRPPPGSVRSEKSRAEEVLFHYSKEADKVFSTDYCPGDNDHKPGGLWLSDDSDYGW